MKYFLFLCFFLACSIAGAQNSTTDTPAAKPEKVLCKGTTKANAPCKLSAKGDGFCRLHSPAAIKCGEVGATGKACTRVVSTAGPCWQHKSKQ